MPALTTTDIGDLMKRLNAVYQPKGVCAATPRRMRLLLDRLQAYTTEVQLARTKYKTLGVASIAGGVGGVPIGDLLGGGDVDVAQWRRDMANWQYRLAEYQSVLDSVPEDQLDTAAGCDQIYALVTAPLLDGIWYEELPGVVLSQEEKTRIMMGAGHPQTDVTGDHPGGHSNPKPPDAITPFSLGNQIIIYQDFQRENAERFFEDLLNNAKKLGTPDDWPWWVKAALVTGAGVIVGIAGLYVYQMLPAPRQPNPRRRRKIASDRGKPYRRRKLSPAEAELKERYDEYMQELRDEGAPNEDFQAVESWYQAELARLDVPTVMEFAP
jgi:hypothetical protein